MANCRYCATDCPEQGEHDRFFDCALYTDRKPTNADRIRGMTDEELAEELWRFWIEFETEKIICSDRSCEDVEAGFDKKCLQCILDWLRQPVDGERR